MNKTILSIITALDTCENYLRRLKPTDAEYNEWQKRRDTLLVRAQEFDDADFNSCESIDDFNRYIRNYQNLKYGVQKNYNARHLKDAVIKIKELEEAKIHSIELKELNKCKSIQDYQDYINRYKNTPTNPYVRKAVDKIYELTAHSTSKKKESLNQQITRSHNPLDSTKRNPDYKRSPNTEEKDTKYSNINTLREKIITLLRKSSVKKTLRVLSPVVLLLLILLIAYHPAQNFKVQNNSLVVDRLGGTFEIPINDYYDFDNMRIISTQDCHQWLDYSLADNKIVAKVQPNGGMGRSAKIIVESRSTLFGIKTSIKSKSQTITVTQRKDSLSFLNYVISKEENNNSGYGSNNNYSPKKKSANKEVNLDYLSSNRDSVLYMHVITDAINLEVIEDSKFFTVSKISDTSSDNCYHNATYKIVLSKNYDSARMDVIKIVAADSVYNICLKQSSGIASFISINSHYQRVPIKGGVFIFKYFTDGVKVEGKPIDDHNNWIQCYDTDGVLRVSVDYNPGYMRKADIRVTPVGSSDSKNKSVYQDISIFQSGKPFELSLSKDEVLFQRYGVDHVDNSVCLSGVFDKYSIDISKPDWLEVYISDPPQGSPYKPRVVMKTIKSNNGLRENNSDGYDREGYVKISQADVSRTIVVHQRGIKGAKKSH